MDYALLGNRIRNCRKSRGMSQARLAEMLDVSVNYIGQIELAERHIGLDLLENISIVLDISILSLLYEVNTGALLTEEINLILRKCTNAELMVIGDMVRALKSSLEHYRLKLDSGRDPWVGNT